MSQQIPLSPIDQFLLTAPWPLQLVFEFPSKLDAKRVEDAFHMTAQRFVGATATLSRLDEHSVAFDLSRNASEIRVTTDGPDIPLHACIDSVVSGFGKPLARARIVDRGSLGTAIGFSMSHVLADGYGFFLFLAAWAAQARGIDFPAPNCNRTLLSNVDARATAKPLPASGPLPQSGYYLVDEGYQPKDFRLEEQLLPLTQLQAEKRLAAGPYSIADLIAARLWKACMQDAALPSTTLACPVDLRRHREALGPLYFGNAFLHATCTLSTSQLRAASAPELAQLIHAAIAEVPQRIDAAIAELEGLWSQRGLAVLSQLMAYPPDSGLLISNMSRVTLDAFDFGTGPATAFDCVLPATASARIAFVLPAGDNLRLLTTTGNPL